MWAWWVVCEEGKPLSLLVLLWPFTHMLSTVRTLKWVEGDSSVVLHPPPSTPQNRGTPLHLAAENDHAFICTALVEAGAEVDAMMSMVYCVRVVDVPQNCRLLRSAAITPLLPLNPQRKSTPLHLAAENGHAAVCTALVEAGAEVNMKDTVRWGVSVLNSVGCCVTSNQVRRNGTARPAAPTSTP